MVGATRQWVVDTDPRAVIIAGVIYLLGLAVFLLVAYVQARQPSLLGPEAQAYIVEKIVRAQCPPEGVRE